MEENQHKKFLEDIMGSDRDFYENYLKNLSEEQLQKFLDKNPEFSFE